MRQSRIHTPQALAPDQPIELTGPEVHYITRVLRLSVGDAITLFNGDGRDYAGEIGDIRRQAVVVHVLGSSDPGTESPLQITLVQAISRGERMDYSVQKATELGVYCIQPVSSRRVEVRLDEKRRLKRLAHWQGVVISACEQCGRAVVPEVRAPLTLEEWLATDTESPRLLLDPQAQLKMSAYPLTGGEVAVLVGPEGGFGAEELGRIQAADVTSVSLGKRILRTETAGPAAIVVLQGIAGDI